MKAVIVFGVGVSAVHIEQRNRVEINSGRVAHCTIIGFVGSHVFGFHFTVVILKSLMLEL